MLPAFYQSCNEMISKWDKLVCKDGSCELDVWPFLVTLRSDVISRTTFGSNFELGKRIFQLQTELAALAPCNFSPEYHKKQRNCNESRKSCKR
ncbi:hypothetical protein ACOSP7_031131 [Xanthoceras sorbifolium]